MHLAKVQLSAIGGLVAHDLRYENDGVEHGNENIDAEKTARNRVAVFREDGRLGFETVTADSRKRVWEALRAARTRHKDVTGRNVRSDAKIGSLVVTLPRGWPEDVNPVRFFGYTLRHIVDTYPGETLTAAVHMDETTPHMHVLLLPTCEDGRQSWNKCFTRSFYKSMHEDMQKYWDDLQPGLQITLDDEKEKLRSRITQKELDRFDEILVRPIEEEKARLNEEWAALAAHRTGVENQQREVSQRKRELDRRERQLDRRERQLQQAQELVYSDWQKLTFEQQQQRNELVQEMFVDLRDDDTVPEWGIKL